MAPKQRFRTTPSLRRYLSTAVFAISTLFASVPLPAHGQQNVGELFAADASVKGAVVLANSGTKVMSGSSISAGEQLATLKLERGGTMLICPNTSLAITTSQNGRQLMFSMNTGNLEMDYPIGAASDNLLTPDFRLLLPGPGRLHLAVRVSAKGDTCVQSLSANSSAVVVSEGMGEESYQVKPNEAVIFNGGRISGAMPTRETCGCPTPPPSQVAKAEPPPPQPKAEAPKPDPAEPQTHMVVDAPFIYRASEPVDLTENVAHLKLENKPMSFEPVVLPPATTSAKNAKPAKPQTTAKADKPAQQKSSFLGKIGAFFAAIFH